MPGGPPEEVVAPEGPLAMESLAAFALESPATATLLRGMTISDGPFIEAKEVVLGFCIVEAPDLDAALAIAKRNPILHQGGGLEVRPVAGSVLIGVQ